MARKPLLWSRTVLIGSQLIGPLLLVFVNKKFDLEKLVLVTQFGTEHKKSWKKAKLIRTRLVSISWLRTTE